ncbi:MAG: phage regulatory CII family protein [Desulfovibrionaceae bacterium]
MARDIQYLILEMVQNCPKPMKNIAAAVGKPYSTLMRELDPEDRRAKLGVEMLLPLMRACNSVIPLRHLAEELGYRVASAKDITPDKPTFFEELLDTYQALVDYHRIMLEGGSVEAVAKCRETLIRQAKEDYAFYISRRQALAEEPTTGPLDQTAPDGTAPGTARDREQS